MTTTKSYRVYYLDSRLLSAVKAKRTEEDLTWESFLTQVVETHLDEIKTSLLQLGFRQWGRDQSARLPVDPATLDMLREAAEETGIPATQLLFACLQHTAPEPQKRPRKPSTKKKPSTRKSTRKTKTTKTKASRGARAATRKGARR